ncbi:hypothetical protein SAMN05216548_114101 [Faunimonas pinastri]|uniref:Uncharacterized protein n=1 Tax=Faunimonas pinastri TaxID=1855383 RepID=A0A1H9MY64_9HYPH|nr:hypothetical protein [Faunimonas pinastri]SER28521.1 hypothetical protein SAMN05216548_114101 [Faunimonas pinastri]
MSDGKRCFLAYRKTSDIQRAGERDISSAVRKGTAAWAIDDDTLLTIRAQGIRYVGVLCKDTGDKWLTVIDRFYEHATVNRWGRCLPLSHFRMIAGSIRL